MRLLLDTHIAIWWVTGALSDEVRAMIGDPENDVFVSIVSAWEIAIKNNLRRPNRSGIGISVRDAAAEFVKADFVWMPIQPRHAFAVEEMAQFHGDPFDRMLVAQAIAEGCRLVTHDKALAAYGDHVLLV